MRLRALIERLQGQTPSDFADLPDVEVLGVQEDSRRINTGDLFIARRGHGSDGKQFIADAHKAGAVAVVADEAVENSPLPVIVVKDAASAASVLANAVLGDPSGAMKLIGITGTNGKTTTAFILRHLLRKAGIQVGLIGTCEIDDSTRSRPAAMTTPGPVTLAEILASMREKGCQAVAMEASSHALHQGRCAGLQFAAAGFTNLTGDHLDYHATLDEYAQAKAVLFMSLSKDAPAVVNAEDSWSQRMLTGASGRPVSYSTTDDADYAARDLLASATGTTFVLKTPTGEASVSMGLIGRHNVQNALCAAALAGELYGLSARQIADALADAREAPGRLERVDEGQPFTVLVDYAHTDDALDNVLRALRPITEGRLHVVFGCGGDRDRYKRPRMAAVAEREADAVYVTSDNPRTEDPRQIIDDILAGFEDRSKVVVEPDRRQAIVAAISAARQGDVVLLAGKGHETYQIVGDRRLNFDDAAEARKALRDRSTSTA